MGILGGGGSGRGDDDGKARLFLFVLFEILVEFFHLSVLNWDVEIPNL